MEILTEFDFDKRPSRSRYAKAVKALVEDGVKAVKLKRGEDFPEHLALETVQGSISTQVRQAGKRARTFKVDNDSLVVGLDPDNTPRRRRAGNKAKTPEPVGV